MGILDTISTHRKQQKALEKASLTNSYKGDHSEQTPVGSLVSPKGRRNLWLSFTCSWMVTASMCTVCVFGTRLVDHYFDPNNTWPNIPTILMITFAGAICALLFSILKHVVSARSQLREENLVRRRILRQVFALGPARLQSNSTGKIVSLASESAEKLMLFRQGFLADVLASFTAPALVLVFMAGFVSGCTALVLALFIPIIPAVVYLFEKLFSKTSNASRRARARLSSQYLDAIGGLTTLQLLGASERIAQQLADLGEDNRKSIMRLLKGNQLILLVIDAAFSLTMVTVCAAMTLAQLDGGAITPGQGVAALALAMLLLEPIDQVGAFFYIGMAGMAAGRGIGTFLSLPTPEDKAQENSTTNSTTSSTDVQYSCGSEKSSIMQIKDLSFAYGNNPVLTKVDLNIQRGEKLALLGVSGSGKSTLLNLIKGFLLPDSGLIHVTSREETSPSKQENVSWHVKDLTDTSAMVTQTTWLFTGTIRENLVLACVGDPRKATEENMWKALEAAHLAEDIRQLPQGLDTDLFEGGTGLSTGQAQRLSLARALLSGRQLLLLDEPTSAVDLDSERHILSAVRAIEDRTIIMSTHRKTALDSMNRMVTLENGQLKEGNAL